MPIVSCRYVFKGIKSHVFPSIRGPLSAFSSFEMIRWYTSLLEFYNQLDISPFPLSWGYARYEWNRQLSSPTCASQNSKFQNETAHLGLLCWSSCPQFNSKLRGFLWPDWLNILLARDFLATDSKLFLTDEGFRSTFTHCLIPILLLVAT